MLEILKAIFLEYFFIIICVCLGLISLIIVAVRTYLINKLVECLFNRPPRIGKFKRHLYEESLTNFKKYQAYFIDHEILPNYVDNNRHVLTPHEWLGAFTKADSWKNNSESMILLKGQGGSGKSVTLRYIWRTLLEGGKGKHSLFIPIYFDLKNDYDEDGDMLKGVCAPLKIQEQYKNWGCLTKKYFNLKKKKSLHLMILADGYNEASEDSRSKFDKEIYEISHHRNSSIRVILSSRYIPLNNNYNISYHEYQAEKLSEDSIIKYMDKKGILPEQYRPIMGILYLPMLLTIYCHGIDEQGSEKIKEKLQIKQICRTAGDIFWNYSRSHLIPRITGKTSFNDKYRIKDAYIIIFHILPYIGYRMEEQQKFTFNRKDIDDVIQHFCCEKAGCLFNRDYISAHHSSKFAPDEWNRNELRNSSYILGMLCEEFALLEMSDKNGSEWYSFNHHLFRDFYAAVYEYNRSKVMLHGDTYIEEKPVLFNCVRVFYHQMINVHEIKGYVDHMDHKVSYAQACNMLSDLYYYGDHPDIPKDFAAALSYAEKSADAGSTWGQWNVAFMYKKKAGLEQDQQVKSELYKKAFYYAKKSEENGYYGGYDILAQFYMYGWVPYSEIPEQVAVKQAVSYLKRAEAKGYCFAYNKHGDLFEKERIRSENHVNEAFKLFKKSADLGETWAKSRVAFYIRHHWRELDEYKNIGEENAMKKAFEICNGEYELVENTKEMMNPDYIHGYGNILMNLGEHYLHIFKTRGDEEIKLDALKKALYIYTEAYLWQRRTGIDETNAGMMALYLAQQLNQDIPEIDIEDIIDKAVKKYQGKKPKSPEKDFFKEEKYFQCYQGLGLKGERGVKNNEYHRTTA